MDWTPLILAVAILLLGHLFRRWWAEASLKRRFRRAGKAEARAAHWLRKNGFQILAVQPEAKTSFRVGEENFNTFVRADYLVRRRFRRYVVEVKSGSRAPDPSNQHTRRQLREYAMTFRLPLFLFDAEAQSLRLVEFDDRPPASTSLARLGLCLAFWLGWGWFF